ncbi:aldehyde dehydrogenase family protein [Variovorax boronicumulans]|uniref:aldehyde dehydrogenase family protein n=1 Tax=Variovorax boronicumulans TaxID=436515 RepID=UPI00339ADF4B
MTPQFNFLIGGRAVGDARECFAVINPSTGELLGEVAKASPADVAEAVRVAQQAQPGWAARSDQERAETIRLLAATLRDNAEQLAAWVAREQGKPLGGLGPETVPGARFELSACQAWCEVNASLSVPHEVVFEDQTRRDEVMREPYGVIAAIAPWNWPLMIAIWQIVPALRMGNAVVLKPSEYTSIATLEMVRILAQVLPPGVLNVVTGAGDVGAALVQDPRIGKILFTGSTATGSRIAAIAAQRIVPTTLELGGNDAAVVLPDADPQAIAMGLFWGAFINMGQTCACIKRLYVHDSIHDAVVSELSDLVRAMPVGDPLAEGTVMGPIQNRMQFDKVTRLVRDTVQQGRGRVVCGGEPLPGPGYFFPLTLITGVRDGDAIVDEEQFGPVLPIIRYDKVEEAIASANRLDLGLGASVWGQDPVQTRQVASQLQAGTVWVNQHGAVHPMVPFGGTKRSGWGVEFGVDGLKSVSTQRVISIRK